MNIDEDNFFNEKLQDQMGKKLLSVRGIDNFRNGKISTDEFIVNLSKEWAALPKDSSNRSYWGKVGNNKALTDYKTIKELLEKDLLE